MRLTRQTDYALRILLHAAADPSRRLSIAGVAELHGISKNHVMKVVNLLANHGLLATVRGRGGGFSLGRDAADIRLGEVVRLTEPDLSPADCDSCVLNGACGLTPMLRSAVRAFLAELDRQTLADAVRTSSMGRLVTPLGVARAPGP
ncbi:MAG: Rrf2 family transcriptional regulator [Novosphingobium sp.]